MSFSEKNIVLIISVIHALRMFGLFNILPVISSYNGVIAYSNVTSIGIAIGIYGLTQAFFQLIMGIISDVYGRKKIIILGLTLFVIGSLICGSFLNIYMIIIGRAIQGSGSIGSVLNALMTDLIREDNIIKAISIIGMVIGLSFLISIILSPLLNSFIGLHGMFLLSSLLGILSILIAIKFIPSNNSLTSNFNVKKIISRFNSAITNYNLMTFNFGIMTIHILSIEIFNFFSVTLEHHYLTIFHYQSIIYLYIFIISSFFSLAFIIFFREKRHIFTIIKIMIIALFLNQFFFIFSGNFIYINFLMIVFFTCFLFFEAFLPSLVSRFSTSKDKGSAMGIFSSFQFLGVFFGGTVGSFIVDIYNFRVMFIFNAFLSIVWLLMTFKNKFKENKFFN